jgi:[ribosomal protein S5]-alanine N-acetyltransferase
MQESESLLLQTERLILREFREEDWQAVHEYGSDPETVKYMIFGPNTEEDTKAFIQRELGHQKEMPRSVYNFALINRNTCRLIGACAMMIRNAENKEGEIGYILNRSYWNQGYMSEAAARVISFGFERLGLHRIFATCDPANTGSYRVMEKNGMQREGYLREYRRFKGVWRDFLMYSILEKEWSERKHDSLTKTASESAKVFEYREGDQKDLELIRPLWEKLKEHHMAVSMYRKDYYSNFKFEIRKEKLLEKSRDGALYIDLVSALSKKEFIGYCVTSIDAQKQGEIESIYVEKEYRGASIGDNLMKRALSWLESRAAGERVLRVAEGNEAVFAFYRRYAFYPRTTILEQREITYPEN